MHGTVEEEMLTMWLRGLGQPDRLMEGVKGCRVRRRDDRLEAEIMVFDSPACSCREDLSSSRDLVWRKDRETEE